MKVIPKIRMKQDELWWCGNNLLCGFRRTASFDVVNNLIFKCVNHIYDFSTFVLMRDFIVTGDRCVFIHHFCTRIMLVLYVIKSFTKMFFAATVS